MKNNTFLMSACALAACVALGDARAQAAAAPAAPASAAAADTIVVTGKRSNRLSKGATNLPIPIKETPQSISTLEREEIADYGLNGSNDALRFATGINVEEWETNRTNFNARGFDVMLTQVDGLGMTNDWGLTVGQLDTFLFERVELIRGANGLLTGVGNSSGTINYVRKRPTNKDMGQAVVTGGSHDMGRVAVDVNKVLTADGAWAGRVVAAFEDKDSYLRALHNRRTTIYGVVDGQIGDDGVLTMGFTYQNAKQKSPMWGSLVLNYADGSLADFPTSSSTSQDWTKWDTRSTSAFIEYAHTLSANWEAKFTFNHNRGNEESKLFYAYGVLNPDNTGLGSFPYRSDGESRSNTVDGNITGRFDAFGRQHEVIFGLSHSKQKKYAVYYDSGAAGPTLPAFPYGGNVYPEPTWGATSVGADGTQQLTRLYAATRLQLTDGLKTIVGVNGIKLKRDGTAIYGGTTPLDNEKTDKFSPYVGLTYDITPDILAYGSYSDIFQAQDQRGIDGHFLPAMKGVNAEVGVKAEWLNRKLLTTFAVFSAEQRGLATIGGRLPGAFEDWYEPKDVTSRGFEIEATGRLGADTKLTVGYTQLRLTGPDGNNIYEWVPRKTFNVRGDTRVLPKLRVGGAARWQSDVSKIGGARQDGYAIVNAFAAYELTDAATVRFNIDNVFDKKYIKTVQFGAIYGAPRSGSLTLDYKF